jgi:hypothetical protein
MQSIDESTLLQTCVELCPFDDAERAWAFLVFCGLIETKAHAEFIRVVVEKDGDLVKLGEALLEFATKRAELVDPGAATARRLWQYFEVGQSLEPEKTLGENEEGTQPGVNVGS